MTPHDLGFPEQFESFRPAQEEAIEHILTTEKRFVGIGAPPGVGKSAIAYAIAKLLGGRTVILTATLGLQDQYSSAGFPGLVDMRGRGNFACWEGGTCEDGGRLGCKDRAGCPYLAAFRAQQESDIVVTSYAYWLAVHDKAQGVREADTLICDEAGLAPEALSRALDYVIYERELYGSGVGKKLPGEDLAGWKKLAEDRLYVFAVDVLKRMKALPIPRSQDGRDRHARDVRRAEALLDKIERMAHLDANWVITEEIGTDHGRAWRFECIWPGRYREKLFRYVPRVILMSATLRPKTLGLLGVAQVDCDFREWPRQFPAANGPVIWIPTVRLNHRMDDEARNKWLKQIDTVLSARSDRRGIIHTVSYARAREINEALYLKHSIVLNGAADPESQTARNAFEKFVRSRNSSVLVSPSFSTGWDFAGTHAEYQIIAKLPIPDTRSKVMQARVAADPSYADYLTAQELVQACGRVVRSASDRGETFIVDDSWAWFRNKASFHLPKWFKVRREEEIPPPLPKL